VALALGRAGHSPTIVDIAPATPIVAGRLGVLLGAPVQYVVCDVRDTCRLDSLLHRSGPFDAIIHLAGRKSVSESIADPLGYYRDNLDSTIALLATAKKHAVRRFVFSSSATVYGSSDELPLTESGRVGEQISNPYGRTKYFAEEILRDYSIAEPDAAVSILRYFNPIGADESGEIGEVSPGVPANIMPFVSQVAAGMREYVEIFGGDYPTPDGTGLRDYIHVTDLAQGHLAALDRAERGWRAFNLGTGVPTSVRELVHAFEIATGRQIPTRVVPRRPGDVAASFCDVARANRELGWRATLSVERACADYWRWQVKNPFGYLPDH